MTKAMLVSSSSSSTSIHPLIRKMASVSINPPPPEASAMPSKNFHSLINKMASISISPSSSTIPPLAQEKINDHSSISINKKSLKQKRAAPAPLRISKYKTTCRCGKDHTVLKVTNWRYKIIDEDSTRIVYRSKRLVIFNCSTCRRLLEVDMIR